MRPVSAAILLMVVLSLADMSDSASAGSFPAPQRLNVSTDGRQANNIARYPGVSASGRFVVFQSPASNLIGRDDDGNTQCDPGSGCDGDNNNDIFVRDRDRDTDGVLDEPGTVSTALLSVLSDGAQTHADSFEPPAINADGRFVAFTSDHAKLANPNDQNCFGGLPDVSCRHVYVRDRDADQNGTFDEPDNGAGEPETRNTRVSVTYDGSVVNGYAYDSAIDATGRFVAFLSEATNLVPSDTNGITRDVFVRDLQQMSTSLVSVNSAGVQANAASLERDVSISGNGSLVAFSSVATNLVGSDTNGDTVCDAGCDTNGASDVFVHNRATGMTQRVSVPDSSTGNSQGNGRSEWPELSADGRYVVFASNASNLVLGDTNNGCNPYGRNGLCWDVFVRDLLTARTIRVSVDSLGSEGNNTSDEPTISGNGQIVGFKSNSTNLIPSDGNGVPDVFSHDRDADRDGVFDEAGSVVTLAISVTSGGTVANGASDDPAISADGHRFAFISNATNLVQNDTNNQDIFGQEAADLDRDGVFNADEIACGSDHLNTTRRPERRDGPFAGQDDDGDTVIDEALPTGSDTYDCDGDGWTGIQENLIFGDAPSTIRDQDPCGNNGWPADLSGSNNVLNIADINSFLAPARAAADFGSGGAFHMFGHNLDDDGDTTIEPNEDPGAPGGATFDVRRWNLQLPPHIATTAINIGDLNGLITGAAGSPARPPMFDGQPAFFTNGGLCPWPPGSGGIAGPMGGGGGASVDQISVDTGPPGPLRPLSSNGKAALGDRDGDTVLDAEGYDTPLPDDTAGICGNGLDDDSAPGQPADGVPDDGCQVPLTPRETCINIIDDGVKNADEDAVVAGQDRANIDITVGVAALGGVPSSRPMSAWQYALNWDVDVLDIRVQQRSFLILSAGGASPFTGVGDTLPDAASPFTVAVSDAGPGETGAGVLSRLTVEGNGAGLTNLTLTGVTIQDAQNTLIPVDLINGAKIAVSKDLDGDGVIEAMGDQGQESFTCPPP